MKFVYILENGRGDHYTGLADDPQQRLHRHNAGEVISTKSGRPWSIRTFVAFSDPKLAVDFERYLKSASGRAFAKKRL
jgi:predicted GIY-YIG superfamily endonuclease